MGIGSNSLGKGLILPRRPSPDSKSAPVGSMYLEATRGRSIMGAPMATYSSSWGQNKERLLGNGRLPLGLSSLQSVTHRLLLGGTQGPPARTLQHLDWLSFCFLIQARSPSQSIRLRCLLSGKQKKISWFKFPFRFVSVALRRRLLSSVQPRGS